MARPTPKYPTQLELEILKILWREGPRTVGQVRDTLAVDRDLAYTSVMTILTIMYQKGYVSRDKQGAGYLYEARVGEKGIMGNMLRDLVDRVFEGSSAALLSNLLETSDLEPEDLKNLRKLINKKIQEDRT